MIKLISIGLLAGLFFSSTFILNRVMSLEGGHWVWSASLRYVYMTLFLMVCLPFFQGASALRQVLRLFCDHWKFWIVSGSIGFGGFYSLICFSADHAPGWVVATTWQLTIIASLFVLIGFGRSFPRKTWLFSSIIFAGVLMVNLSYFDAANFKDLLLGGFPVLIAAFCYPIGNQMVWEAKHGNRYLPMIQSPYLENPFNKVLLLSLGSLPFWCFLVVLNAPPFPSRGQLVNTALVALFSGICATSLFLYARSQSKRAGELAAVDATQSSEVVFALAGEMLVLNAPWPTGMAVGGIFLVFAGLVLFIRFQEVGG
ncbi:MAG: multidrug resistance efflux transporter family protein [Desulfosarcina sp.]|nr:multidrug resistance efflux transporter family protein [Desulfobacterales bacterium]